MNDSIYKKLVFNTVSASPSGIMKFSQLKKKRIKTTNDQTNSKIEIPSLKNKSTKKRFFSGKKIECLSRNIKKSSESEIKSTVKTHFQNESRPEKVWTFIGKINCILIQNKNFLTRLKTPSQIKKITDKNSFQSKIKEFEKKDSNLEIFGKDVRQETSKKQLERKIMKTSFFQTKKIKSNYQKNEKPADLKSYRKNFLDKFFIFRRNNNENKFGKVKPKLPYFKTESFDPLKSKCHNFSCFIEKKCCEMINDKRMDTLIRNKKNQFGGIYRGVFEKLLRKTDPVLIGVMERTSENLRRIKENL